MTAETIRNIGMLAAGLVAGVLLAALYIALRAPRHVRDLRRNAVAQSRATTRGQLYEQFALHFPEFGYNPRDARFLGAPIDFVVFDGLDEGALRRIVFIEIKTGNAVLTERERAVRQAVRDGAVYWQEIRLSEQS